MGCISTPLLCGSRSITRNTKSSETVLTAESRRQLPHCTSVKWAPSATRFPSHGHSHRARQGATTFAWDADTDPLDMTTLASIATGRRTHPPMTAFSCWRQGLLSGEQFRRSSVINQLWVEAVCKRHRAAPANFVERTGDVRGGEEKGRAPYVCTAAISRCAPRIRIARFRL